MRNAVWVSACVSSLAWLAHRLHKPTAIVSAGLAFGVLTACHAPQQNPTEMLAVEVANFRLSATDVAYDMKYGLYEPSGAGMSARVTFENPANRAEPLVIEVPVKEGVMEFNAVSPPMRCISNGHRYKVETQLLRDGAVVDMVSQDLVFEVPVALLKSMNVGAC